MELGILGAGLSGVTLAAMLQASPKVTTIELLEKAAAAGGLCRSFPFGRLHYDLGPHIIFSKKPELLKIMLQPLGRHARKLRRANKVFHDGRFVKYPFENELSALSEPDRQYCLNSFLNNPYGSYLPQNMLQFFLSTFGEGITNLYLRPYNEKIWKYDPAFMDTQMVERIPRPPAEDIIKSARGAETEGYVHQLHFYYPKTGGIEALFRGFADRLQQKVTIRLGAEVEKIEKSGRRWNVFATDGARRQYDHLVSTIPLPRLVEALGSSVPQQVADAAAALKFNSIAVCVVRVTRDSLDDNFAVMIADKQTVFHRLTKLDFLFPAETGNGGSSSLLAEVTYRPGDLIDRLSDAELMDRVVGDLRRLEFIPGNGGVEARQLRRAEYAYVIYELNHRRHLKILRDYCEGRLGLSLHGRFGEFAYLNMDAVIERSIQRCSQIEGLL